MQLDAPTLGPGAKPQDELGDEAQEIPVISIEDEAAIEDCRGPTGKITEVANAEIVQRLLKQKEAEEDKVAGGSLEREAVVPLIKAPLVADRSVWLHGSSANDTTELWLTRINRAMGILGLDREKQQPWGAWTTREAMGFKIRAVIQALSPLGPDFLRVLCCPRAALKLLGCLHKRQRNPRTGPRADLLWTPLGRPDEDDRLEDFEEDQKTTLLPEGLWQNMVEFLSVAEVVKMETRAVSRFFSSSKIWLAHLLKLVDVDSLPQCADGTTHPAHEWAWHYQSWNAGRMDRAMEIERNASEGFQGCRCFLNGIAMWHASYPEMVQPFLTTVIQCVSSRNIALSNAGRRMWGEVAQSVPGLGPTANGALHLLSTKGRDLDHFFATQLLFTCMSAYHFSKGEIAELVRNVRSFMSWELKMDRGYANAQIFTNAVFTEESDRCLAFRYYKGMINAERKGKEEAAAKEQLLLDLLADSG
eukprot:Skav225954  [mRNA]  locus=scaffold1500:687491:694429:- [translate_table: standard]